MAPFTPLYIAGKKVPASDGSTFEVKNPFSNEVVGICASASSDDCLNAVLAAGEAFKTWEHSPINERRDIVLRAAQLAKSDKYKTKISDAVTEETAAVPSMALFNWAGAITALQDMVMLVNELHGLNFPSGKVKGASVVVERRAMGVM